MEVGELWGDRVSDYTDKVLAWGHRYKDIVAVRLRLAIALKISMFWWLIGQLLRKSNFDGAEFSIEPHFMHPSMSLDPFSLPPSYAVLQPSLFLMPISYDASLKRCKIFGGPGSLPRRLHFCTAVQMEMALRVNKDLTAKLAARERVLLLDEPFMAAFISLDWSLTQLSRLTAIVGEVLEWQYRYHALFTSHCIEEIDHFMSEPTV